jgi:thiol:disulfide interchange protein DsbD
MGLAQPHFVPQPVTGTRQFSLLELWRNAKHLAAVKHFKWFVTVCALFIGVSGAFAAATDVSLVLSHSSAKPGDEITAGIRLLMKPGWHTYWRNPGGSGAPTTIKWTLPPGITAGAIQWPVPRKLPDPDFTTYIYENDVLLIVPLKIAANVPLGDVKIRATVSWLECEKQCVPGEGNVDADLTIAKESAVSDDAPVFETWRKRLPQDSSGLDASVAWQSPATGTNRIVQFDFASVVGIADADFFPYDSEHFDLQSPSNAFSQSGRRVQLQKIIIPTEKAWPTNLAGLLIIKPSSGRPVAHEINLTIKESPATSTAPTQTIRATSIAPVAPPEQSLVLMLAYAFLGGLILNVMPCVLPVIALKILGFVNQGGQNPARVRLLGMIYALGVLASFLALAVLVTVVKHLGHSASWGMQFQNPAFLVFLTVLVLLVALNLFGIFEVTPGSGVMGVAGNLASKEGATGAFLNGVLATVLATPCTAPFLGPALGFAFTQPTPVVFLMFLTIGMGLAFPYLLLSFQPAWLKFLPKPGVWMEKFKMLMGFPMLATAVWLFTLATSSYGEDADLFFGMFLVILGLAAWIWGEFVQRGRSAKPVAATASILIVCAAYFTILEKHLDWRHPAASISGIAKNSSDEIDWKPWTPQAVLDAQNSGRPVLVDFTAKWCLTCQLNKKTSIEIPSVRAKLKAINAVALLENSPAKSDEVIAELNRRGRAGVPLVLVFPKKAGAPPEVLPELLTPQIVLDALDRAAAD